MPDYSIFGGCLRSEITFPELRESSDRNPSISWTLHASPEAAPARVAELLGEHAVTPGCRVRLFRHAGGYRLRYDDTGIYDVSLDGRRIAWTAGPQPGAGAVRADVTGRVLSTALHAAGLLCLHASAVTLAEGTVAFLAPKYHGKSTLALALARAGARLVTDDVLPVHPGPPARAIPGVHQVKLWDDTARLFGVARRDVEPGEKHLVHEFPDARLEFGPTPLRAVYLLSPVTADAGMRNEVVLRTRLPEVPSALALVRHATLGALLGGREAPTVLERAVQVAREVPVYRLETLVGLDRVPQIVARLSDWHGAPANETAGAGMPGGA